MKLGKFSMIALCAVVMTALVGCSKGNSDTDPAQFVISYFETMKAGELTEAYIRNIMTSEFFESKFRRSSSEMINRKLKRMNEATKGMLANATMMIDSVEVNGDTAIVTATIHGIPQASTGQMELKMVNGAWKLNSESKR